MKITQFWEKDIHTLNTFFLPKLQATNNPSPPTKFQLTKQCKGKDHNTNHVKKQNNTMNTQ